MHTSACNTMMYSAHEGASASQPDYIAAAMQRQAYLAQQSLQGTPLGAKVVAKGVPMSKRRLVQVFIADPDENVALDKSLIYEGERKLTDLENNELFHEIPIMELLKAHNEYRQTVVNKKVKERTEYLEPIRIRDLRMVVVELATF